MELGLLEKDALIEKLAKEFYRIQGYVVRGDYRMQDGTHPHERACVEMAITAIEEVEFALADLDDQEDEETITWQKGKYFSEERQVYFCDYGRFKLHLLVVPHLGLTQAEVYLNKFTIFGVEENMTKEEATAKLQYFLRDFAKEVQVLSLIDFEP